VTVVGAYGRDECTITDGERVRALVRQHNPDVVFNAAAFTDVDGAESRSDESYQANAIGPELLARVCHETGAKLVHYSTDFVFDGEQERLYVEFDPPSPQGEYARSKVAGERLVAAATPRAFVMRVGCLYGRGGRNFPRPSCAASRRARPCAPIATGSARPPGWRSVVAARRPWPPRTTSACTTAPPTARPAGSTTPLPGRRPGPADSRVVAVPTAELPMKAQRPRRAVLDNRMLRLRGLDTMGDWQSQARAFMASEAG
jgi:dTDP-4-dehydrorhamnose reductase